VPSLTLLLSRVIVVLVIEGLSLDAFGASDPWASAPISVQAANSWHEGQPIPPEFLHYRESGDMPAPTDSSSLISQVTNLEFLAALAIDLSADQECREDAFTSGMYASGPSRFFTVLARHVSASTGSSNPWLSEIRSRIAQPHVVVDALSIADSDMPPGQATKVLDRIERELRGGAKWETVYRKYADEFGYKTGNRTKIGTLGHWVVFDDPALGHGYFIDVAPDTITWQGEELPRRLSRLAFLDASHVSSIMHSSTGEIIRLHSSTYREYVLYQVQEVYPGKR